MKLQIIGINDNQLARLVNSTRSVFCLAYFDISLIVFLRSEFRMLLYEFEPGHGAAEAY